MSTAEHTTPATVAPLAAFAGRYAKRVRSERVLWRTAGRSFYFVGRRRLDSYRRRGRFLVIQSAERNRVERNLREEHFGICQPAGGLHLQPQPAHPGLRMLVYFRQRQSRLRPYLSVGTGVVHFSSFQQRVDLVAGSPSLPSQRFSSNLIALHVPVGMDVKLRGGWMFRYSFSETLTKNPISDHLSPPGPHSLKNFQNLFGIIKRF